MKGLGPHEWLRAASWQVKERSSVVADEGRLVVLREHCNQCVQVMHILGCVVSMRIVRCPHESICTESFGE